MAEFAASSSCAPCWAIPPNDVVYAETKKSQWHGSFGVQGNRTGCGPFSSRLPSNSMKGGAEGGGGEREAWVVDGWMRHSSNPGQACYLPYLPTPTYIHRRATRALHGLEVA